MHRPLALLLTGLIAFGDVAAQGYPARPIRAVIGFPPGSTPDIVTRALAERMAEDFGRPLIVDNRPGAGGSIAAETVARSQADGYTLMVDGCSAPGLVYSFVMNGRPPLDPFRDFAPIGRMMRDHWIVTISAAPGVDTLAGLIAVAKAKPGTLTFASNGTGSSQHLQAERFALRAGFKAVHVPYNKESPIPDLLAGRTSFMVQPSPAVAPLVKSGRLKGLAVLSAARMQALPDIPTTAEEGLPDLLYNAGICLYGVAGTPAPIIGRLSTALNRAGQTDAVRSRFSELGLETVTSTPEQTAKFIRELMALVDELRLRVFGKAR